jgi:hypothetical protein
MGEDALPVREYNIVSDPIKKQEPYPIPESVCEQQMELFYHQNSAVQRNGPTLKR